MDDKSIMDEKTPRVQKLQLNVKDTKNISLLYQYWIELLEIFNKKLYTTIISLLYTSS